MDIDLTKYSYQGEWVEFKPADPEKGTPAVRLLIRPYPHSLMGMSVGNGGEMMVSGRENLRQFDYCLTAWEGLDITLGGEPAECTSKTKKIIYDFDVEGIGTFVMQELVRIENRRREALKNSGSSRSGS